MGGMRRVWGLDMKCQRNKLLLGGTEGRLRKKRESGVGAPFVLGLPQERFPRKVVGDET